MDEQNYVEVKENRAMVYLPEDAVEVSINAVLYKDGELLKVQKVLNNNDIHKAFDDADRNYIEDTDMFITTEIGREWLEQRKE